LFHSWCVAASLVNRRPQVPLPVVRKRCRRRHLTTVQKAVSISRLELRLIGGPLTERCHSPRQQLLRLNIRPACQSRLLPNRRRLRPIHGPAFTSGVGPALVALNHKTGKPPRGARADIVLLGSSDQISRSHDFLELCSLMPPMSRLTTSVLGLQNENNESGPVRALPVRPAVRPGSAVRQENSRVPPSTIHSANPPSLAFRRTAQPDEI
jgi:hypothetical protein